MNKFIYNSWYLINNCFQQMFGEICMTARAASSMQRVGAVCVFSLAVKQPASNVRCRHAVSSHLMLEPIINQLLWKVHELLHQNLPFNICSVPLVDISFHLSLTEVKPRRGSQVVISQNRASSRCLMTSQPNEYSLCWGFLASFSF